MTGHSPEQAPSLAAQVAAVEATLDAAERVAAPGRAIVRAVWIRDALATGLPQTGLGEHRKGAI